MLLKKMPRLNRLSLLSSALVAVVTVVTVQGASVAKACPFCTAASQTLRQEMTSMDVVAFAELVPSSQSTIDGQATFTITSVVQGEKHAKANDTLVAPYFGPGKSDKTYLVMAVLSDELLWSSPLTLTDNSKDYIEKLFKLSEDSTERLKFFIKYLENPESLLAGDAYDEFALAPYEDVKAIKDAIDREQLWSWLNDNTISPDRKRLYYTLLGIVAQDEDAVALEAKLRSENPDDKAGLDALIACYLTIVGEKGLPFLDKQFLTNTKVAYADTYAAIMALRFQGTEGGVIDRDKILESMRLLLDRPDYADLVIPDLARWEDWSQIDKLVELFEKSDDTNSWVRLPVINYMRACPLPKAKEKLDHLEKLDPKAFQRANLFFPIQQPVIQQPAEPSTEPAPSTNDSSYVPSAKPQHRVARLPAASGELLADTPSIFAFRSRIASGDRTTGRSTASLSGRSVVTSDRSVNPLSISAVTLLTTVNFALAMMFVLSGRPAEKSLVTKFRLALHRCLS